MAGLNQVTIIGNLGQDPDLRYTQSQEPVATLSVATSDEWTDKDGQKHEETEWHRVVVWGKQAENCAKYLAKGHKVAVTGKLKTRSWEDKDGVKRYTTEIVANRFGGVYFLGQPQGGGTRPPAPTDDHRPAASRQTSAPMPAPGDAASASLDDIPF